MKKVATPPKPAIRRLVEHHGGPQALVDFTGGAMKRQQIVTWVTRGWASPFRFPALAAAMEAAGITAEDLYADMQRAQAKGRKPRARRPLTERRAGGDRRSHART